MQAILVLYCTCKGEKKQVDLGRTHLHCEKIPLASLGAPSMSMPDALNATKAHLNVRCEAYVALSLLDDRKRQVHPAHSIIMYSMKARVSKTLNAIAS